ncbi:hypothetical protein D3C75_1222120 [compost metagenome]
MVFSSAWADKPNIASDTASVRRFERKVLCMVNPGCVSAALALSVFVGKALPGPWFEDHGGGGLSRFLVWMQRLTVEWCRPEKR